MNIGKYLRGEHCHAGTARVVMKNDAHERTKLRASEQRRLDHAYKTMIELMEKHVPDERDAADLYAMKLRLETAIKNQHIKDKDYATYKAAQTFITGDF